MNSLEIGDKLAADVAVTQKRVSLDDILGVITKETFFYEDTFTLCVLTLRSGFKVTGESACVDPANYDKELGEKFSKEMAVRKIWPLEGYLLANKD